MEANVVDDWFELAIENSLSVPNRTEVDRQKANIDLNAPPRKATEEDHLVPFRVAIRFIELLPSSLSSSIAPPYEFQFTATLFDALYGRFYGKTWSSAWHKAKGSSSSSVTVKFDEPLYFHIPVTDDRNSVVLQFLCRNRGNESDPKVVSVGWSVIRLKAWRSEDDKDRSVEQKKPFYHGSARALLFLKEPVEDSKRVVALASAFVHADIKYHEPLFSVIKYIPECTIFGRGSIIGGLEPPRATNDDILKRPQQLSDQRNINIEHLEIDMEPSIGAFEDELCRLINEDRLERRKVALAATNNLPAESNARVSIVERRLRIGIHNGHCYIEDPLVLHLSCEQEDSGMSTLSRKLSFRQSARRRTLSADSRLENDEVRKRLYLRNPVRLDNVSIDQRTGIVFVLEYMIAMPSTVLLKANEPVETTKVTYPIRWAVWFPTENKYVSITLRGDDILPCDELFMYKSSNVNATNPALKVQEILRFAYRFDSEPPTTYQPISSINTTLPKGLPPMLPSTLPSTLTRPSIPTPRMPIIPNDMDDYMRTVTFPRKIPGTLQPPIYQQPTAMQFEIRSTHPGYSPMSALASQMTFANALSRASYARFQALGFPTIKNKEDKEATMIDVNRMRLLNSENEMKDPLNCNEIHFHFLAFLKEANNLRPSKAASPRTLYFMLKFYRFGQTTTSRVMLEQLHDTKTHDSSLQPYILWRLNEHQSKTSGLPGLIVKYQVDGGFLGRREQLNFLRYLDDHVMYIDIFDGDTLFPVGSCGVELRFLFRDNQSAIQALLELDVFSPLPAESNVFSGMENQYYPQSNMTHSLIGDRLKSVGKLIMRIGNVGSVGTAYPTIDTLRTSDVLRMLPSSRVITAGPTFDVIQERAGEITTSGIKPHRVVRANRIVDVAPGLSTTLNTVDKERLDADRERKLARMNAVRQRETDSSDDHLSYSSIKTNRKLRELRATDLKSISMFRQQTKHDDVLHHLKNSITREFCIELIPGNVEFFEFSLQNPMDDVTSIMISTDDDELSVVTSAREWRQLHTLFGLTYTVEEDMFTRKEEIVDQHGFKYPQLIMRRKETINIPFKLQSFLSKNSSSETRLSPHSYAQDHTFSVTEKKFNQKLSEKQITTEFRTADGIVISRFVVHVRYLLPTITQTIRCINPQNSLFKGTFQIPNPKRAITVDSSTTGMPGQYHQVYLRPSDPNVVCVSEPVPANDPCHMLIKASSQNAPTVNTFLIFMYYDGFMHVPIEIWEFQIHAVQRLDLNCIQFQTATATLLLRGKNSARLVQCFGDCPDEMRISPSNAFNLPANTLQEVHVLIRSEHSGVKNYSVNVVDSQNHKLVETWILRVDTRVPMVSKTFVNKVQYGQSQPIVKRISYTNPYQVQKSFFFSCTRPDLVHLQHQKLDFQANEKRFINITLLPAFDVSPETDVFLFINNDQDANEDVYLIRISYVHSAQPME